MAEDKDTPLAASLKNNGLDSKYWSSILESKLGVTDLNQVKHLDATTLEKLKTSVRYDWEFNALKEFLGVSEKSYESLQVCKKDAALQTQKQAKELVAELKSLKYAGKNQNDQLIKEKEEHLRQILNVPKEHWIVKSENISLDDVIRQCQSHLDDLDKLATNRRELSASELLAHASSGLALRGILMTRNSNECIKLRKVVLETPLNPHFVGPIKGQTEETVEFSSRSQADLFHHSLDTMGHSVAASVKGEGWGFQAEAGFSKTYSEEKEEELESHHKEHFHFREIYSFVPTAAYELNPVTLKLSQHALVELKKLEQLNAGTGNKELIQSSCEKFLRTFGSHVNTGILHFGGIYEWVAKYSNVSSSRSQSIRNMVQDALSGFVSMSYSGFGFSAGGSVSGEHVKNHAGIAASYETSELTKINMHITKKGGPQEVNSLPLWKMGLMTYNDTWALIDRGEAFSTDFMGIWELLRNHQSEFRNVSELAGTLKQAWQSVSGMVSIGVVCDDKTIDAIDSMNAIVNRMREWNSDDNLAENAVEYLQQLLNEVQILCSEIGDSKHWVDVLKREKIVSVFFVHIVQIENEYAPKDLPHVNYLLRKLTTLAGNYDFPSKDVIVQWVRVKPDEECLPSILRQGPINDIPSLLSAIKDIMLPALQIVHASPKVTKSQSDQIDIQATVDLALGVDHLRAHLEKAHSNFQLFFLITNLSQLLFNPAKKNFESLLTLDSLASFLKNMQKHWEDYQSHEKEGSVQLQAFLVHLCLEIVPFNEEPQRKEMQFKDALKGIQDLLTSELNLALTKFVSSSPFQWEEFTETLQQLKKGNSDVLKQKEICIRDLEQITTTRISHCTDINQGNTDDVMTDQNTEAAKILAKLGLTELYPMKISLQDVMSVGVENSRSDLQTHNLPWLILQRLIMIDYNGRDGEISKVMSSVDTPHQDENCSDDEDFLNDILGTLPETQSVPLNPLDVFVAIFSCCDLTLRQTLAQKMFMCRLAVPFIWPQMASESLVYSLWALRTIVVEWRDANQKASETSVVSHPFNIVSFVRFGRPFLSKSKLLNYVLTDQGHNTFWNSECPLGNTNRVFTDGLVEATWFLPSGKQTDTFKDVTMFLNLRGDATIHDKQIRILRRISNVVVAFVDITDVGNSRILEAMKSIHESCHKVVLLPLTKEARPLKQQNLRTLLGQYISYVGKANMTNTKVSGHKGGKDMNTDEMKHEVRKAIAKHLEGEAGKSIQDSSVIAENDGVSIDEMDWQCQTGKQFAEEVLVSMTGKSTNQCRMEMLPLQGEKWQEWSTLLKKQQRSGGKGTKSTSVYEMSRIQNNMTVLRQKQLEGCNNLSPLIKTFISGLIQSIDVPVVLFFLQWLKLHLDDKSRDTLPELHRKYHEKWMIFKMTKDNPKHDISHLEKLKKDVEAAEKWLANASLGLEHLFREVAQIYEAAIESNQGLIPSNIEHLKKLPEAAAKLLLKGQCMEIMDGDASNVPLTWVMAVFTSLKNLVGDKNIFVLSVLGIQSSGKSTLFNTMFGLQFAVSAGRCTRGVYMQLVKVDKNMCSVPYDYVMVVDTEGLRAPELGQLKHDHDNELATFVIGLGDVTIMNIKGENVAEVKDVLQIAVHAFLRMKLVNENIHRYRTCIFIHQNVPALNAKEKMMHGCQKLQDNLDEMTVEACAIENIADIHSFKQVIDFDGTKHVWYFSDLWHGDPPMAPANPGYSAKVQEVKRCLLHDLSKNQKTFLNFSDMMLRVRDLWKGVLADDFVFSFRNSLAAKAYNSLESEYYELTWVLENDIMNWLNKKAAIQLERCSSNEDLEVCCSVLLNDLEKEANMKLANARSQLEDFFEHNNLKDIIIQWQSEKLSSLTVDANEFTSRAKTEIYRMKESHRLDLLKRTRQGKHEEEILQKAKELADQMKGKVANEESLRATFDGMWIHWLNELATRSPAEDSPIDVLVEHILWQRLPKDKPALRKELEIYPLKQPLKVQTLEGSISVDKIKKDYLSVRTTIGQDIKSFFTWKDPWLQCRHTAVQAVDIILRRVDIYLADLQKQDSKFQQSYATNVIKIIVDGVEEHNHQYTKQYPFTLLPTMRVKLAVHVCRYAVQVFNRMQEDYDKNYGQATKLASYKNTAWNLFKNMVNQSTEEVIVADMLCDRMKELMKKTIKREMPRKLLDGIVHHFGHVKYNLIVAILDDLAMKGMFEPYRYFLTNARDFALQWVTDFTNEYFFKTKETELSDYVQYAITHVQAIISCMRKSIRGTTEHITKHSGSTMKVWVQRFSDRMQEEIAVPESDMKYLLEHHVGDFANLERLLIERLVDLENSVIDVFKGETATNIKWEGTTPYRQILDKLWGCEAQCPFCNEPCQMTDPVHSTKGDSHRCIQHRPSGVGGDRWDEDYRKDQLLVESCNYKVQWQGLRFNCRDCKFECRKSGHCSTTGSSWQYHESLMYKTFLPKWDIAPDASMDSSKYWMWFMVTYQHQLKDMYNAQLPNIPDSWKHITKEQARNSLRESRN